MMDVINMNGDTEYDNDYWMTHDVNICDKQTIKSLMHPALEEHNKSLTWIQETAKEIDANIVISTNEYYDSKNHNSAIYMKGRKSNISYKIEINYYPRIANLCAKRIDEISINEENFRILNKFIISKMITFNVRWYDLRIMDWSSICIENESGIMSWPGDIIVSVMNALYNDIYSALDSKMNTLRSTLIEALPVYWFVNKQFYNISYNNIALLSESLEDLHYTDVSDSMDEFSQKTLIIRKLIKIIYQEDDEFKEYE
jgi:hypothetical protein